MADSVKPSTSLQSEMSPMEEATKAVNELYDFRDHYFESHSLEEASQREDHIQKRLAETLNVLDRLQDGAGGSRAEWLLQRGRALNVQSSHSQEAEEALSKAVKLEPRLAQAWVHLGECYWKNGDVDGAKNCFTGALSHHKDKVALRNLSMVLRACKGEAEERTKNVEDSVDHAKEAVKLDPSDGTSWLILGNAYLSLFFAGGQSPKILKQCMSAYQQAERDSVTSCNPDLHFNRSTVHKYQEDYKDALEGFSRAGALDPSWPEPKEQEKRLLTYLDQLQNFVISKGKIRNKKLQGLIHSIKDSDLGPYEGGSFTSPRGKTMKLDLTSLIQLKPDLNAEKVIVGKVVCSLVVEDPVPLNKKLPIISEDGVKTATAKLCSTFCMVDRSGQCAAVTLYNASPGYGVKIGDSVAIPEPFLQSVDMQYKEKSYTFNSIRVDSPLVLVVNGRKLGLDKQAPTVLSVSTMSE